VIGRAAVRVDQDDLARVHAVHRDELADEDLVRAVGVEYLKLERERVADLGGWHGLVAAAIGNLHGDVRRVDDHLLRERGRNVAVHAKVHLVRHGLVGEVVLAGNGQPEVGAGNDGVVMLNHHVVQVTAETLLPDVALEIVVRHAQLELERALHVLHARVGRALRVHLAVEKLARLDSGHHVAGAAIDGHVVAGAQLVRGRLRHVEIGFLKSAFSWAFLEGRYSCLASLRGSSLVSIRRAGAHYSASGLR